MKVQEERGGRHTRFDGEADGGLGGGGHACILHWEGKER